MDISYLRAFMRKPKFHKHLSSYRRRTENRDRGEITIFVYGQWTGNDEECGVDRLLDFGESLYEAVSTKEINNNLPRGFVHALLKKNKQFEEGKDKNFIPAIVYQLERNVRDTATIQTKEGEKKMFYVGKTMDTGGYFGR
jgi:hypothetical protein